MFVCCLGGFNKRGRYDTRETGPQTCQDPDPEPSECVPQPVEFYEELYREGTHKDCHAGKRSSFYIVFYSVGILDLIFFVLEFEKNCPQFFNCKVYHMLES